MDVTKTYETGADCPTCDGSGLVGPAGHWTPCDAEGDNDCGEWYCNDGIVTNGVTAGQPVRVASMETDTVSGSVYVGGAYAVVRWTDYVAGDWSEAYTGTNRVAVAVARLAVLALPAIHDHGFVDDAVGFAARVESVLLGSVGTV